MTDFSITTPKLGKQEGIPTIFLPEAFVSEGSSDVYEEDGEYRHNKGRLFDFLDANGDAIAMPINIWAVTAVSTGAKKFTISGNHAATITTNAVDDQIRINGSSDNDGLYTIDTVTDVGANTEIVVTETVGDGTVDGNVFVGGTPIQAQLRHIRQANDAEVFLVATAYHIFTWSNTTKFLTVRFTSGSPGTGERWELVSHFSNSKDQIYATNNVDVVQAWDIATSPSGSFADLGSATGIVVGDIEGGGSRKIAKAKHLASYESYLFIGHITYDNSDIRPQRHHWSSRADTTDFDTAGSGDAGSKDFTNAQGFLMGYGKWTDFLIVFMSDLHYRGWIVTSDEVFNWDEEDLKVGTLSADTIVNDKFGRLYWLANDMTIKEFRTPFNISGPTKNTLKRINVAVAEFAQAAYIDEHESIVFALPANASATNNILVEFFISTGSEFIHNIPVRSFGDFTRQETFTYDSEPFRSSYANYAEWGAAWLRYDINRSIQGFPLDMVSDYNGFLYELNGGLTDAGSDYTSTLIFATTLTPDKARFPRKRVNNGAYFYFNRKSSGSVTISLKRDGETSWQSIGSVSLDNSAENAVTKVHLPFDEAFFYSEFRLQSTANMELLGIDFRDFELEDDR